MKKIMTATLVASALLSGSSFAADAKKPMPAVVVGDVVRTEATVLVVDMPTRTVVLRGADGKIFDAVLGNEVKNLAQVKQGDVVVTEFSQALAVALKKGSGKTSASGTMSVKRAEPGQKPGGVVAREIDFVADVIAVDTAKSVVTIKGPEGRVVDVKVKDPKVLAEIKAGDQVEGTYLEALAIVVMPKAK